mgnify:CR=1 FL=1
MTSTLQVGEVFEIDGYDLLAMATMCEGEAIVLCNNSTHYLVAVRAPEADEAMLVDSVRYGTSDAAWAYAIALRKMTELAAERSREGP